MGKTMAKMRHELFVEMEEHLTSKCKELKLSDDVCEKIACSVSSFIAEFYAGQVIYFPAQTSFKRSALDAQIYKKFNGSNYAELAREYGYSEGGVRKVIARASKVAHRQGNV
ncbi:Mor transcription activator family protein [Aggregatibacter actinomycetemcomitans]|uniref:Mor transcription activator family protein n=1 Tax=Aggregatibacter actinomycetemcomitans TaxID=714 RepID=UPI00197C7A04|nr:Mor transcription activator family protein [Aggregatibacter actinomycetemcomitans]MBN6064790.1 DNA-binding protein [Aggregatibacter actinomycetemcomitans]MBN6081926.1 DNA-binding protein [Aggregatibacter actinomycetemcomitans]MBN6084216.1 DNA-binding protein [Aggregatibacter actinomycetemcomitans]